MLLYLYYDKELFSHLPSFGDHIYDLVGCQKYKLLQYFFEICFNVLELLHILVGMILLGKKPCDIISSKCGMWVDFFRPSNMECFLYRTI